MANFPLSASKRISNTLFISGQIGQKDGQLISGDLKEQITQTINNIQKILEQNDLSLKNVVDVTAFLIDQDDYTIFNEIYAMKFKEPYPTRTTVIVKSLPLNAKVELKIIASKE